MHPNEPDAQNQIGSSPPSAEARESVSKVFVETRRSFDQDLRAVADALRIRYDYLLAIEEGRFQDLPGSTYAVGFVRTYAEYLNLDVEEIVNRFKEEISGFNSRTELVFPKPNSDVRVPGSAIIFFSALLIGIAYGTWFFLSADPEQIAESATDAPAAYPSDPPIQHSDLEADPPASPDLATTGKEPLQPTAGDGDAPASTAEEAAPAIEEETELKAGDAAATESPQADDIQASAAGADDPTTPVRGGSGSAAERPVTATEAARPASVPSAVSSSPEPARASPGQGSETAVSTPVRPERRVEEAAEGDIGAAAARAPPAAESNGQSNAAPASAQERPEAEDPPPQIASTAPAEAQIPEVPASSAPRTAPVRKPPAPRSVEANAAPPPLPPAAPPRPQAVVPGEVQVGARPQGEAPMIYGAENRDARIVLRAIFDSYVLVRDEKDGLLMTKVLRSGDEYRVPNRDGLSMLTGNAGGLRIEVDGRRVPSVGPVGAIVRNVALDPDRLRSGTAVTR